MPDRLDLGHDTLIRGQSVLPSSRGAAGGAIIREMAQAGDSVYRFTVGAPDAERSSVWRLWTHTPKSASSGTEIYLAMRNIAADFKASLHASGSWRVGFSRDDHPAAPPGQDRAMHKWRRPEEMAPGWTRAFQVGVPSKDVVRPRLTKHAADAKVHWVQRPAARMGVFFDVFIAAATADLRENLPGRDSMGTRLIFDAPLATSETLCLLVHEDAFDHSHIPREEIARQAAAVAAHEGEDIRAAAITLINDGTWAFIDVAVDPPPDES